MIELGKKYRTEGHQEVRIYAVDGNGLYPVHGAVKYGDGWSSAVWTKGGLYDYENSPTSSDLVEVKPRIQREVWVNVYHNGVDDELWFTRRTADEQALTSRIACVKLVIDVEEGHGL
jgi:hypothetical protein